jgi:CBS domain-containing protein
VNVDALLQRVATGLGDTVDPRVADEADARVIELATRPKSCEEQRRLQDQLDALEAEKAWYRLGVVLEERGDLEEAAHWMRKAAEVSYGDAACRLSRVLVRQNQTAEAHQWHAIAVEAGCCDPDDADHLGSEPLHQPTVPPPAGGHATSWQEAAASPVPQDSEVGVDALLQADDDEGFFLEAKSQRSRVEGRWSSFLWSTLIEPAADLDVVSVVEESSLAMITRWTSPRHRDLYVPFDSTRRSSSEWHSPGWLDLREKPILITSGTGVGKTVAIIRLFKELARSYWREDASFPMTTYLCQAVQARQFEYSCSRVLREKIRPYEDDILAVPYRIGADERYAPAWLYRLLDVPWSQTWCLSAMSEPFSVAIPSQRKRQVRNAMLQWDEVVTLDEDTTADAALEMALQQQVRRLPITDERGKVTGLIYLDDLAEELHAHRGTPSITRVEHLKRPPTFVSPDMYVDDVVEAMQRSGVHIAVVVEGDRQPIGLVTLAQMLQPPRDDQKRTDEVVSPPPTPNPLQIPLAFDGPDLASRLERAVHVEPVDRSQTRSAR